MWRGPPEPDNSAYHIVANAQFRGSENRWFLNNLGNYNCASRSYGYSPRAKPNPLSTLAPKRHTRKKKPNLVVCRFGLLLLLLPGRRVLIGRSSDEPHVLD